ncbi:MAG: ferredoxin--NADP reductase [Acidobacteriota bacterium]|nr:ferredoxin--NADP reductase [Acidobacteriota bacterium]
MAIKELNAVVEQRYEVAPGLMVVRVVPDGWDLPDFKPGQFAVLGLPPDAARCAGSDTEEAPPRPDRLIRRAYSIASSSVAREYLELYITLVRSGGLTPRLFALQPGDRVWLGPKITGNFTLDQAPEGSHLVLVATGTGLAPYMSMLRTMMPAAGDRRIAVLIGARHSWDLGYQSELMTMDRLSSAFSYHSIISRPAEEPVSWGGPAGYVQDLWREQLLEKEWGFKPAPENTSVFLCGTPAMIDDMVVMLAEGGFREHSRKEPGEIFVERYW